jgi:hypothetical protein
MVYSRIRGFRMGKALGFFILFLVLGLSGFAFALTAEDYFQQGKSALENQDLLNAQNNFQSALALDPNHQGANLFYSLTRILMISNSTDFNTLLDRAGVGTSGRDIFNWTADFTRDPRGKILLPSNSPTGAELQAFLKNDILPEINGALDNLSKVTSNYETTYQWFIESGSGVISGPNTLTDNIKFWRYNELIGYKLIIEGNGYIVTGNTANTITVTPNWSISNGTYNYKIFEEIEIDYGDVLVFKGSLLLGKAGIFILNSYDLNVDIDTIVSLYNSMTLNIQTHIINTYNQLLTLLPTQQLSQAKTVLREAINVFTSALDFIKGETDSPENDLFVLDNPEKEQQYRDLLADLNNALDGTTFIRKIGMNVNLTEFFDEPKNLRNYFPTFLKSYFIQKDSFPDPTFGGILPSMTMTELQERLKDHIRERYPSGWVLYDDFSGTNIDKDKWNNWEFVREIRDGKLVSKITSYGSNLSNILNFINPASIYYIEADMSVNEIDGRFESLTNASLVGRFYNDGTGSPGSLVGEVMARIDLTYQWGQLTAHWSVSKSTDGSTWPWVANGSFPIPISLGQSYKLSILWEPAIKRFTFTANGISQYWTSTDNIYPSNGPWKALSTSVWFSNPNLWRTVSATFDNVIAKDQSGNIVVSDDFSSPVIDKNKWSTYEMVSEISDGKLRSKVRSSSRSTGAPVFNDLNFIDPSSIQAIQVEVTPSVYQNSQGANLRARIAGRYYNDGTPGSGYAGDVGAQVTIGGTGVNPLGEWQVWRHTDSGGNNIELVASGTFTTPILLGNTYILFLSWDGSKFTFKLGNEEASYIPVTSINPPHNPWRGVGTRILNPAGKESTIETFFDNVMINSIVVSPQFVNFGAVELGDYFDQTVNVWNDGDDDVTISSFTLPSSPFTIQSNNCLGQTLHSGGSCNIVVRFSPAMEGQFNSKFNILTNYPTVPTQTLNLYGTGVGAKGPPDLVPTEMKVTSSGVKGREIEVSWTVQNQGTGDILPSSRWQDNIYFSTDNVLDSADPVIGFFPISQALPVGGTYTQTQTVILPDVPASTFYLILKTDDPWPYGNQLYESNEANNEKVIPFSKVPDLVPTELKVTSSGVKGREVEVTWTVQNQGTGDVLPSSTWGDVLYLSSDNVWDGGDILITWFEMSAAIPAGGSYTQTKTVQLPAGLPPGPAYLILRADDPWQGNRIFESSDSNNERATLLNQLPDLVVTELTAPPSAIAGQQIELSWTVQN